MISITVISILAIIVLVKYGAHFDTRQFNTSHLHFHGLVLGFPLAILSYVGLESSASLGVEANRPPPLDPARRGRDRRVLHHPQRCPAGRL